MSINSKLFNISNNSDTGGPDYFFWNKELAENYEDRRKRVIKGIYEIPPNNILIKSNSKKTTAYYTHPPNQSFNIYAVQGRIKPY